MGAHVEGAGEAVHTARTRFHCPKKAGTRMGAHVEGAGEAVRGAQHERAQEAEQDEHDDAGADGADEPRRDDGGDACAAHDTGFYQCCAPVKAPASLLRIASASASKA